MENNCLPNLIPIGLKYVEEWLHQNGYSGISKQLLQPDDYGFIAIGQRESLLVQVRTFLHPRQPLLLSDAECDALVESAASLGLIAYAAYLIVDNENNLVGEIFWDRLSKFF